MSQVAFEMPVKYLTGTKPAATDFSQARYKFVDINANGDLILAPAGKACVGILQQPGEKDKGPMELPVMFAGISFIIFGGTVASGAMVEIDANGCAIAANTGVAVGKAIVGGASGDIGCVLLK